LRTDDKKIEIYDKDYNRKGHIRKENDTWIEYDKDWNRIGFTKREKTLNNARLNKQPFETLSFR